MYGYNYGYGPYAPRGYLGAGIGYPYYGYLGWGYPYYGYPGWVAFSGPYLSLI